MNDNTDNEREQFETSFNESLTDITKAIINIVAEVSRLKIQRTLISNRFVVDYTFDIYESDESNEFISWIYLIILDPKNNKVFRYESIYQSTIDDIKQIYNDFVDKCNECGYNTRNWEQIQSNIDFIQYIL